MINKLVEKIKKTGAPIVVGLDPMLSYVPEHIQKKSFDEYGETLEGAADAIWQYNKEIIDHVYDLIPAVKPQIAMYEQFGIEGLIAFKKTVDYCKEKDLVVIGDIKRGDIGSTCEHYAREAFERFKADCVTLSPYMGEDTITPYLKYEDKGIFLLCRTSNKSGDELQMLDVGGERLFERVARLTAEKWNRTGELGLVVGATYPDELAAVRRVAPDIPLLVPGVGAQGGDIQAAVTAGMDTRGAGMVINSGRAILYASKGADWQDAARKAAEATRDAINAARGA